MLLALCLTQNNYKCHVMYVSVAGCTPFVLFNYYFLSGKLNLVAKDCKTIPYYPNQVVANIKTMYERYTILSLLLLAGGNAYL